MKPSRVVVCVTVITFMLMSAIIVLSSIWFLVDKAFGADNLTPCLSHEQAKAKWPSRYLYWRTANHCWYPGPERYASRRGVYGKTNSLKLGLPALDGNGNQSRHGGQPVIPEAPRNGPEIAFPSLIAGIGTTDGMLRPDSLTGWPDLIDFDQPQQFVTWDKRIATAFEVAHE